MLLAGSVVAGDGETPSCIARSLAGEPLLTKLNTEQQKALEPHESWVLLLKFMST